MSNQSHRIRSHSNANTNSNINSNINNNYTIHNNNNNNNYNYNINTIEQLIEYEKKLLLKREKLSLYYQPLYTCITFIKGILYYINKFIVTMSIHPLMIFFILPIIVLYTILIQLPGEHLVYIYNIEYYICFITWWVGLGILSSIG